MPQYTVDEDLALRVERLARRKPFENLAFNDALRRVLDEKAPAQTNTNKTGIDALVAQATALYPKKAPSPKPFDWLKGVPELTSEGNFTSWKAVCDFLKINTAGDSARRRLKKWVELNRPDWPGVPDV